MIESLQDECCLESQTQSCCEGVRRPAWNERVKTLNASTPMQSQEIAQAISNIAKGNPRSAQSNPDIEEAIEGIGLQQPKVAVFATGAKRSTDADSTRYDLIPPIGLRRLAEAYAEGAVKYGDGNWMKGFPTGVVLNHLQKHIEQWKQGDRSEDHLGHAVFGLFCLMHYEEESPEMIDRPFAPKVSK